MSNGFQSSEFAVNCLLNSTKVCIGLKLILCFSRRLLCLVFDEKIANYILKNKDCENQAKPYISFIMQYIGLTMDILLTASVTASPADRDSRQPILLYFRFVNEVYMLLRITGDEGSQKPYLQIRRRVRSQ